MFALEGTRVLDLSHLGPGWFATTILADFGADVTMVEQIPKANAGVSTESGTSHWSFSRFMPLMYDSLNRNKKSIALDLKTQSGRDIFFKLAKRSDVVLEEFRPGAAKRLGVDYEAVRMVNPEIIYCSITAYGQDSPYRDLPGHDPNFLGMAGALDLIGERGGPPILPMNFVGDWAGGSFGAVMGILLAIIARENTGMGQYVDIAMIDGVISLLNIAAHDYLTNGFIWKRGETLLNGGTPYANVYRTMDGRYITIAAFEPKFWANLCRALDREDLIHYQHTEGLKQQEIFLWLKETFLTKTRDQWFTLLKDKDIPIGKVYTIDEAFSDPHIVARQMVVTTNHPKKGKIKQVGAPIKLSGTPAKTGGSVPTVGLDTKEILLDLGYTDSEIGQFVGANVVYLGEKGAGENY